MVEKTESTAHAARRLEGLIHSIDHLNEHMMQTKASDQVMLGMVALLDTACSLSHDLANTLEETGLKALARQNVGDHSTRVK